MSMTLGGNDIIDLEELYLLHALFHSYSKTEKSEVKISLYDDGITKWEFLHADDLVDCDIDLMNNKSFSNVGDFYWGSSRM